MLVPRLVALAVVAGWCLCVLPVWWGSGERQPVWRAAAALAGEQPAEAERRARQILAERPDAAAARVIAGAAAARLHRSEQALSDLTRVATDDPLLAQTALSLRAERLSRLGRLAEAERCLRELLARDPDDLSARHRLAVLLETEGRAWEAREHLHRLIRSPGVTIDHLLLIGTPDSFIHDPHALAQSRSQDPAHLVPRLTEARALWDQSRHAEARALLERILATQPDQPEAQALLGRVLLALSDGDAVTRWGAALTAAAREHPAVWTVLGLWEKRQDRPETALRCFWEAYRRQPGDGMVNSELSQSLAHRGETEGAEFFARRSRRLSQLRLQLNEIQVGGGLEEYRRVAALCEATGRPWEAAGWCHIAHLHSPDEVWPQETLRRLYPALRRPPAESPAPPGLSARLAKLSLPTAPLGQPRRRSTSGTPPPSGSRVAFAGSAGVSPARHAAETAALPAGITTGSRVTFVDQARELGIDFRYFNGADPSAGRAYMFEFSGGGAAVLDYDADGWPDLYLTQGASWPVSSGRGSVRRDRLYRNLCGRGFRDVTAAAGLGDAGMSQGVAVGDFDADGWPDLYVANIGANRLYANNGDGTFRDVTDRSGTAGDQWTTSCVLADLNGDRLPDLYAVNYLAGPAVFERACVNEGRPVQCAPSMFDAEQDRVYLNLGDGRFRDVTAECGAQVPDGKGLGLLAADFDGSGRLSLFVANDTTANFFLVNQTPSPGGPLTFSEQAIFRGLAFDAEGRAQACMGIAADDADGDGRMDLFVTNFYKESNTLYRQGEDGAFVDATRAARLREGSYEMLGFGTQFLDAELDGWPDLILANGNINDFTSQGIPYQMPPQFYRNVGDGTFELLDGSAVGPYFADACVGRGLVRLDWNRDGREEACVTHVDRPVALLTNTTSPAGHFAAVRLRGIESERDAIGAVVTLRHGGRVRTRQLTAGDGFEVSNERRLVFGLGPSARIDEVTVRWPSGRRQTFADLPVDQELLIVEGRNAVLAVPGGPAD